MRVVNFAATLTLLLAASSSSIADTTVAEDAPEIRFSVIAGGGARMHGAAWTLDGTVGQPGTSSQGGTGGLRVDGGFWRTITPSPAGGDRIFANGFDPLVVAGMASDEPS
jgi:hypothetical protein